MRALERVGSEVSFQGFQGERVGASGDVEVEIAPGAPPEGHEDAMRATVGEKAVGEAEGLAGMQDPFLAGVGKGIAVTFVFFVVVEGFGVGEDDAGTFAAGDGKFGVGGGEGFAIECQVDVNARRKRGGFFREVDKTWLLIGDVVRG